MDIHLINRINSILTFKVNYHEYYVHLTDCFKAGTLYHGYEKLSSIPYNGSWSDDDIEIFKSIIRHHEEQLLKQQTKERVRFDKSNVVDIFTKQVEYVKNDLTQIT